MCHPRHNGTYEPPRLRLVSPESAFGASVADEFPARGIALAALLSMAGFWAPVASATWWFLSR